MFKIKNRILLGIMSGITAGFIGGSLNASEYKLGLIDLKYTQIASALFLPKRKINTFEGKIIGSSVRYIIVSTISTLICYVLSFSGRNNAIIKSIGITMTTWLVAVELIPNFVLKIRSRKPLYRFLSILDHLLSGLIISKLILKFGDKSLFPEKKLLKTIKP